MPARKQPTPEDTVTARQTLLDGLARDAGVFELVSEVAPLHPRDNTFPGEVFLHLAADALDWCGASRAGPLALEGLRERFLPECAFRGRQNKKLQYAVLAAAAVHGGTDPDLLDEVAWWQSDDFWQYALFATVAYIRAVASRAAAAVEALRADPDADTVHTLEQLAAVEVMASSPDADKLSAEALTLGQDLGVGTSQLGGLLLGRGICHSMAGRRPQAVAYFRESARLAEAADDSLTLGRALLNLSDALEVTDLAGAAEAARSAATHMRRAGDRGSLAFAFTNLAITLLQLGDWDTADAELTQAADADGLADNEHLACYRGWLAALRGDAASAQAMLATLPNLRASEEAQDKALISLVEAFTAAARGQPQDVLRHARSALAHADAVGISCEPLRWAWPLAARTAHDLQNIAVTRELLALLDSYQPGHLAPMQRAERDLVHARLAAADGDPAAAAPFAVAITSLRKLSTPYHLAHGLLDHVGYLTRLGDIGAATVAIEEARDIARNMSCQPLLQRAADITPAKSQARD